MLYAYLLIIQSSPDLISIRSVDLVIGDRGWRLYDVRFSNRNEFFRADYFEASLGWEKTRKFWLNDHLLSSL